MYVTQSFFHALIASIIAGRAIRMLGVGDPRIKQRFYIMAIIVPVVCFPIYQIITPDRGSILFRLDALFDSGRWLNVSLFGKVPLAAIFGAILLITSLIFIFQEMLPVMRHMFESKGGMPDAEPPQPGSRVSRALEGLGMDMPAIYIFDDDPMLFSRTGDDAAVFLSTGIIEKLSDEELQAAVAHELAHIRRSKRPLLMAAFLLRIPMFFNPIVMMEFRKAAHEEEKVCDDMAVAMTGGPAALAEAIKKFYHIEEAHNNAVRMTAAETAKAVEEHGHNLLLMGRVERLEKEGAQHAVKASSGWFEFIVTTGLVIGINYFVV